jgi:hypothetical protein
MSVVTIVFGELSARDEKFYLPTEDERARAMRFYGPRHGPDDMDPFAYELEWRKQLVTMTRTANAHLEGFELRVLRGHYLSIGEIEQANEDAGGHWFSPGAIAFFNSGIHGDLFAGRYFISDERPDFEDSSGRAWTIRWARPDGSIEDVGAVRGYESHEQAQRAAAEVADAYPHGFCCIVAAWRWAPRWRPEARVTFSHDFGGRGEWLHTHDCPHVVEGTVTEHANDLLDRPVPPQDDDERGSP